MALNGWHTFLTFLEIVLTLSFFLLFFFFVSFFFTYSYSLLTLFSCDFDSLSLPFSCSSLAFPLPLLFSNIPFWLRLLLLFLLLSFILLPIYPSSCYPSSTFGPTVFSYQSLSLSLSCFILSSLGLAVFSCGYIYLQNWVICSYHKAIVNNFAVANYKSHKYIENVIFLVTHKFYHHHYHYDFHDRNVVLISFSFPITCNKWIHTIEIFHLSIKWKKGDIGK